MRFSCQFVRGVLVLFSCAAGLSGCAHRKTAETENARPKAIALKPVEVAGPVRLMMKADPTRAEKVSYTHRANSKAFEDNQVRLQKEEAIDFVSQAETLKIQPPDANGIQQFTQAVSIIKKDGVADLHDFAMPDVGERLEVTADSRGKILKAGDYPTNSIFYVSPVSLPAGPVSVGDTWTMQANWLSLGEMIPYKLDMVSILKGFVQCGKDRCADIEISGEVTLVGPLSRSLNFKSNWRGRMYFAMDAGTVVWSRVDSEERLVAEKARREESSCLEAVLVEPADLRIGVDPKSACEPIVKTDTQTASFNP